jgi:hypothetical protein
MSDLYYKFNKSNGELYVQIWKKVEGSKNEYVATLGSAKKAYSILVQMQNLKEQTKKLKEFATKIY